MNIAKYTASIGFKVDTQDIKKVDKAISIVEKKLKDFSKRLSASYTINLVNFNVNERNLQRALGNALDVASTRAVFEVSRFVVNDRALLAALLRAARRLPPAPPPGPNPPPHPPGPGPRPNGGGNPPPGSGRGSRSLIGAGLYGPLGYGALALAGGGYGLGTLNRRNQEVVSAQLQAQAVVQQAGGTVEQGQASFQWLREQGQRIGFNYLDASPDYNKLLSGLTGAGMSVQQGQDVYKGFAELSRVNKLDRVQQQRVFRALSQIAGKGKLQAEELTQQLAESLPGATSLFARAYQKQIGGNKTGADAIADLMAAMKKGQVKSSILTYAGTLASEQAAPSLAAASTASQAEQARYQNTVNDLAVVASNAGVEEGFARIFRTLNAGLSESNGLVQGLAEGFNDATKWADDLLLFPQSFIRALEGKDSIVADWLGKDQTEQLKQDWKDIKDIWKEVNSIEYPSWMPTLESTAKELKDLLHQIAELSRWKDNLFNSTSSNAPEYSFWTNPITRTYQLAGRGADAFMDAVDSYEDRRERLIAINDPNSIYYNDPAGYDAMQKDRAMASQEDTVRNSMITNQIQIQLNVDAVTLSQMNIEAQADLLTQRLAIGLEQVMVNFPQKE